VFNWDFKGFVNVPSGSLVKELRDFHREQQTAEPTENSDELPEKWGVPNPKGLFPLSMEEALKYFLEEAFQKGGMDLALAVLDKMEDWLKDDE